LCRGGVNSRQADNLCDVYEYDAGISVFGRVSGNVVEMLYVR
jgi:hypothetical protein